MSDTILWDEWSKAFSSLRDAFSRQSTFLWAIIYCAGIVVRPDIRGVSSLVCALKLNKRAYGCLRDLCHSSAIKLEPLLECWIALCLLKFKPVCVEGHLVLFGDGINIGKEGKKMPAVKLMHQSSNSNSKAEYIMGHYIQSLSLAVNTPAGDVAAIPLMAQIHDGIVFSNRDKKTVNDRLAKAVDQVSNAAQAATILVADAYYSNQKMIAALLDCECHLVSRVAKNTVAYHPAIQPEVRKRGRPAKKGEKIVLNEQFGNYKFQHGEFSYNYLDLYWPPAKRIIRFVVCKHDSKGEIILMTTKLDMEPSTIIRLYEKRWLIETGYKTAKHQIGTFAYHFWMKEMKSTKRGQRKQYLHRESEGYRAAVNKKMHAYHTHLQLCCITQGLMIHLGMNFSRQVWGSFNGWLRTIRKPMQPSELVVSNALASTLTNYLKAENSGVGWTKLARKYRALGGIEVPVMAA